MRGRYLIPSPDRIHSIASGFYVSKVALVAAKLDLFTFINSKGFVTSEEVKNHYNWSCNTRYVHDFLDILTNADLLARKGVMTTSVYCNSSEASHYLVKSKPDYIGDRLTMLNNRIYKFMDNLEEGLISGKPQNEIADKENMFDAIYKSPENLKQFTKAMSSIQKVPFEALAKCFDFSKYKIISDIGGSGGTLCASIAKAHSGVICTSYDLPILKEVAHEMLVSEGLHQAKLGIIDFMKDEFPKSDVITMGNILHDWDEVTKKMLIKKAFDALPEGGVFIAIEKIIDDDRRINIQGLCTSLVMLLENGIGFDYSFSEFSEWTGEAGFKTSQYISLDNMTSAAIAFK